jgi:MSHA pilin protein MshA
VGPVTGGDAPFLIEVEMKSELRQGSGKLAGNPAPDREFGTCPIAQVRGVFIRKLGDKTQSGNGVHFELLPLPRTTFVSPDLRITMKTRNASRQAGFTLVELIVVILILGILSALALPKFINMGADARTAKVQGIYGSVKAATQITHAAAIVRNHTAATDTVTVDGTNMTTAYGYPDITLATGIGFAAGLDVVASSNSDQVTFDTTTTSGTMYIVPAGAATVASCRVAYTPATATVPPVIAVVTSGC